MKKNFSTITAACLFFTAHAAAIFAGQATPAYMGLALEDVPEGKSDSARGRQYCQAWIMLAKAESDSDVKCAAKALLNSPEESVSEKLAGGKNASRAVKYLNASKLTEDAVEKSLVARAGDFFLLIFDMPKGSRLRSGMNIMVFEKSGGKILWNPSFSDPLLPLAATSDFHSPKSADGFPALTQKDADTCRNLAGKSLPILCFKNGALLSADGVDAVEKLPEAVFYRKAQNIFYSWKLDEYASYMTEESKNRFNSQFGGMPESERKKILGEYFSWGKTYRKVMDAGAQKLILFTRNKSGAEPYNDAAYLRETHEGSLLISRFGADKSPLDLFLSKYVFPTKQNYADAISKKYLKGHSE